jgi:hypothetical protein
LCRGEFVEQKNEEEENDSNEEDSESGYEENPYLRHPIPEDSVMEKHGIHWGIDFIEKRDRLFPIPDFKGSHEFGSGYTSTLVNLRKRKQHVLHDSYATIGLEYDLSGLSDPHYDSD